MVIDAEQLADVTVQVAREHFGELVFARRVLMEAVEKRLREMGVWEPEDDEDSQSVAIKSKGLAHIDWSISSLKKEGRLLNLSRDEWRVPPV